MTYLRPEDTPGYLGLYGEVVVDDCYRLKKINFVPDVIFDLGANIGVFTRYARELFPNALIVSVEPNKENFEHLLKFTNIENWIYYNAAIGSGTLWHNLGAANGAGESYVSSGIGYDHYAMIKASIDGSVEMENNIPLIMPSDLIKRYVKPEQKFLVKIDIEGGEHAIFQHNESMKLLRKADYICGELHLYALEAGEMYNTMARKMGEAIGSFMPTHRVEINNVEFFFTKKY